MIPSHKKKERILHKTMNLKKKYLNLNILFLDLVLYRELKRHDKSTHIVMHYACGELSDIYLQ